MIVRNHPGPFLKNGWAPENRFLSRHSFGRNLPVSRKCLISGRCSADTVWRAAPCGVGGSLKPISQGRKPNLDAFSSLL
ncbi:hypothetical protein ATI53_104146 [Salipiger aestuarii]|uniref:Uncharacterized protein n=1 Tax=Salipiger aestuarii TaxID=568098 RepID=A0A327XX21_9RHOB|nr:hypothetical protein ATI53_104146 [Salipiger aestuarii]